MTDKEKERLKELVEKLWASEQEFMFSCADKETICSLIDRQPGEEANEHDELVRLRVEYRFAKRDKEYFKQQYDRLFDYWNDKYPDEMGEYIKSPGAEEDK